MTYAMADQGAQSDGRAAARKPAIHTLKLQSTGAGRKSLAKRDTDRFSALLVTWDDAGAKAKGTPEVRTRDLETGEWSGWRKLVVDPSQAEAPRVSGPRCAAVRSRCGPGGDEFDFFLGTRFAAVDRARSLHAGADGCEHHGARLLASL
ncbi:hypothetical protein B1R27_28955, partial [Streptomyces sp. GKU 895]